MFIVPLNTPLRGKLKLRVIPRLMYSVDLAKNVPKQIALLCTLIVMLVSIILAYLNKILNPSQANKFVFQFLFFCFHQETSALKSRQN
jgi:hypothetical protein